MAYNDNEYKPSSSKKTTAKKEELIVPPNFISTPNTSINSYLPPLPSSSRELSSKRSNFLATTGRSSARMLMPMTFDCRDCLNVILGPLSTFANPGPGPGPLIFENPFTGDSIEIVHPEFPDPYSSISEVAKFGNYFWILATLSPCSGLIPCEYYLKEFEIGANCNISHIRDIPLPPSTMSIPYAFGLGGYGGLCATTVIPSGQSLPKLLMGAFLMCMEIELPPSGSPSGTPATIQQLFHVPSPPASNNPNGNGLFTGEIVYIPSSNTVVGTGWPGQSLSGFPGLTDIFIYHYDSNGTVLGSAQIPYNYTAHLAAPTVVSYGDDVFMTLPGDHTYRFDLTTHTLTLEPSLNITFASMSAASSPDINITFPIPNLITNPSFIVPSGWGNAPGWWYGPGWDTSQGGQAIHTGGGSALVTFVCSGCPGGSLGGGIASPGFSPTSTYIITMDVISGGTGGGGMYIEVSGVSGNIPLSISSGVASATWTGGYGLSSFLAIRNQDPNGVTIDNVVVKEVENCAECYNITSLLCDGSGPAGFTNLISGAQTAAGYDGRCLFVDGQPVGPQHIGTTVSVNWVWGSPPPAQLWNFEITGLVPITNPVPSTVNTITAPCPWITTWCQKCPVVISGGPTNYACGGVSMHIYDPLNSHQTYETNSQWCYGAAAKYDDKFWNKGNQPGSPIKEFVINPNTDCAPVWSPPGIFSYIRTINWPTLPSGWSSGNGLCSMDGNTLLMGSVNMPGTYSKGLVKVDISGSTSVLTYLFETVNEIHGDIVYIPSSNTIVTMERSQNPWDITLCHYDITGILLNSTSIASSNIINRGLFSLDEEVYFSTTGTSVQKYDPISHVISAVTFPGGMSYQPFSTNGVTSTASDPHCLSSPISPGPTPVVSTIAPEELTAMSSPPSNPPIPDEILEIYQELFK